MWFAEYRHKEQYGWNLIRPIPWRSQEQAKAACKKMLMADPIKRYQTDFRIVADDSRGTVYQESKAPHDSWRMRWMDVR